MPKKINTVKSDHISKWLTEGAKSTWHHFFGNFVNWPSFILLALVSDSGVKKSLGEKRRDLAFLCTVKGLNDLKNTCEGTVWKVSDVNLILYVLGNLGSLY